MPALSIAASRASRRTAGGSVSVVIDGIDYRLTALRPSGGLPGSSSYAHECSGVARKGALVDADTSRVPASTSG
jgi:hypothetical protein